MPDDSDSDEDSEESFDPFEDRPYVENATTDDETLTHVFKASLGTGATAMPIAFLYSGLYLGVLATLFTGIICTHCTYVLVKCAHRLYYKEKKSKMSYADITERVFLTGPKCLRKFAWFLRLIILIGLFLTYFGACCVYIFTVAENFQQIWDYWTGTSHNIGYMTAGLLIPFLALTRIPDIKSLATVSMVGNIFMACGLTIACYYFIAEMPADRERNYVVFSKLPAFFSITIFALQSIGVIMPLENCMETPTHMLGMDGVLVQAMIALTVGHAVFGYFGYRCYGLNTDDNVILNLPVDDLPAQLVSVMIAIAVYCSFGLEFVVCLEIACDAIKDRFAENPESANYTLRTVLVIAAVVLAIIVPTMGPLLGILGAFFFSILGLIMPSVIETIMDLESGFGMFNWILWKNIAIITFGVFALFLGTKIFFIQLIEDFD